MNKITSNIAGNTMFPAKTAEKLQKASGQKYNIYDPLKLSKRNVHGPTSQRNQVIST